MTILKIEFIKIQPKNKIIIKHKLVIYAVQFGLL